MVALPDFVYAREAEMPEDLRDLCDAEPVFHSDADWNFWEATATDPDGSVWLFCWEAPKDGSEPNWDEPDLAEMLEGEDW